MAQRKTGDRYANIASITVNMSAANTLTWAQLDTGISLGTGVGMLIDQIDYTPGGTTFDQMTASGDWIALALATTNSSPDLQDVSDRRIIHTILMRRIDFGTAASAQLFISPKPFQFFPPMIVAAPRLYMGMMSSGLATLATGRMRIYYRYIDLTSQEYLEIAETFILVG